MPAACAVGRIRGALPVELYEVMRTTAAIRQFTEEPVDDDVLFRIFDNARFAPSGGNRQGWRVVVIRDAQVRERIRDLYALGWREYVAHREQGLVPFAPDEHGHWEGPAVDLEKAREVERRNEFVDNLHKVPVLLAVFVDVRGLALLDVALDRVSIVGGGSVYPFVHNVLLAARNEGLGGVMTTVLCRREPEVKRMLEVPEPFALVALVALGHPVQRPTDLTRMPVEELVFLDRFEGESFTA